MDKVIIYTDGSCHGNPGPGGWAAILLHRSGIQQVTGCDCWTTNGRMELKAIVEALKSLNESCDVCIRSDSKWIVDAINRGQRYLTTFTHSKNRKHADLWGEILRLSHKHMIRAEWVKGHAHDDYNNLCDKLANEEVYRMTGEARIRDKVFAALLIDSKQTPTIIAARYQLSPELARKYYDQFFSCMRQDE